MPIALFWMLGLLLVLVVDLDWRYPSSDAESDTNPRGDER